MNFYSVNGMVNEILAFKALLLANKQIIQIPNLFFYKILQAFSYNLIPSIRKTFL